MGMMKLNIKKLEQFRSVYSESPREFAKRLGVSHAWYYQLIKKDGGTNPSLGVINKIAKGLDIEPRDLII